MTIATSFKRRIDFSARDRYPQRLSGPGRKPPKPRERQTGTRSAPTRENHHRTGDARCFDESPSDGRNAQSRCLRAVCQLEDRCGSAIDRAIRLSIANSFDGPSREKMGSAPCFRNNATPIDTARNNDAGLVKSPATMSSPPTNSESPAAHANTAGDRNPRLPTASTNPAAGGTFANPCPKAIISPTATRNAVKPRSARIDLGPRSHDDLTPATYRCTHEGRIASHEATARPPADPSRVGVGFLPTRIGSTEQTEALRSVQRSRARQAAK